MDQTLDTKQPRGGDEHPHPATDTASAERAFWATTPNPFEGMPSPPEPKRESRYRSRPERCRSASTPLANPMHGGSEPNDVHSTFVFSNYHGRRASITNPDFIWERLRDLPGVRS